MDIPNNENKLKIKLHGWKTIGTDAKMQRIGAIVIK